jgi:hypothetical protein
MAAASIYSGCGTALVTPFQQDLSLDEEALRRLVRRQVDAHQLPGSLRNHGKIPRSATKSICA